MVAEWPAGFADLRLGTGCPMCRRSEEDLGPHGLRVFEGRWSDAVLGRHPARPGYTIVVWKGRHVVEPGELTPEEAAGFWSEVARVADAVEAQYEPVKMNWLHLGNGVPHLHVHLVPRPLDDPCAGGPLEPEALFQSLVAPLADDELQLQGARLRARLEG